MDPPPRVGRERATLPQLFDKYIEAVFEGMRKGFKTITPIRPISIIETICHLLAALLPNLDAAKIDEKDMPAAIENYFVFAAIWAFGGPLGADKQADHRKAFNELWRGTFSTVKYPKDGLVFDYYFDPERFEMVPWADSVPSTSLSSLVRTRESSRSPRSAARRWTRFATRTCSTSSCRRSTQSCSSVAPELARRR